MDLFWPGFHPDNAEPELLVNSDAVLPMAVSTEGLQAVSWRDLQIVEASGGGEMASFREATRAKPPKRLSSFPSKRVRVSRQRNNQITS